MTSSAEAQEQCAQTVRILRTDLTDTRAALMRALDITRKNSSGSGFLRRSVEDRDFCADSASFLSGWAEPGAQKALSALPVTALERSNSAYPRDRSDGAMWSGVGLNASVAAGLRADWRFIHAAAYPSYIYQQNKEFEFPPPDISNISEFRNPYIFQLDLPKRMGAASLRGLEIGHSFVEARGTKYYAAVSNENIWLGPTQLNSLILSNTAPAFPHLRFGTRKPVSVPGFRLEAQVFYGRLTASDFADEHSGEHALYQGVMLVLEPKALPGLSIGVARVLRDTATVGTPKFSYLLKRFLDSPFYQQGGAGDDPADREGAAYVRWVHPASSFEIYMEWARDDFPYSVLSLLLEPDYSQVWAAGFQKAYVSDKHLHRFYGELLHLGLASPVRGGRDLVRFYSARFPGMTNKGQMLGAGTGPGSDAQSLGWDMFGARSRTGVMIERVRYDDDTYYERFSRRFSEGRHDVEITAELRRMQMVGPVSIDAVLRLSQRYNRDFLSAINNTDNITSERNIGTELSLSWAPRF